MTKQEWKIGDCLELLPSIEDKSIDLIIADPPYNINKADWDNVPDYLNWCMSWIKECKRVLKDNGSMYIFHSEMPTIARLMNRIEDETDLIYKQFITWNKRFKGAKNKGFLDGFIEVEDLRNYQQMTEYVLFYTFQDETGLTKVKHDLNNFIPLREYARQFQEALGMSLKKINETLGHRKAEHFFYWKSTQWELATPDVYAELCKLPIGNEFVRKEYEDLRKEYEDLRYTFNNQKTHHAVWEYEIERKDGHETPKPVELIKNIILHSSNEGDLILDPFRGSGKTLRACRETNRNCLGIELNEVNDDLIKKISLVNTPLLSNYVL